MSRRGPSTFTSGRCGASSARSGSRRSSAWVTGTGSRRRSRRPHARGSARTALQPLRKRMRLGSRFAVLFGVLSAAAAILLIVVVDATLRQAVDDRIAFRLEREQALLVSEIQRFSGQPAGLDEYLRRTARELACRITIVARDGRVTHDTDVLPADVAAMENHGNRPEVLEARRLGTGTARRFSTTENEDRLYFARTLSSGDVLRLSVAAA